MRLALVLGMMGLVLPWGGLSAQDSPKVSVPPVGPWLLDGNDIPASWLGYRYQGRTLFEPINLIVIDTVSRSPEEAVGRLMKESSLGGYAQRWGHTSDYWASIGTEVFPQIAEGSLTALSDAEAFQENNHGRLFGPWWDGARFVFAGAFSREAFDLFGSHHHRFVSFNRARDDFAARLTHRNLYRVLGRCFLGNLRNTITGSSGDHDGAAVVLETR